jgi:hypothetical protein
MFTFGAFVLMSAIAWYAGRKNESDRSRYDSDDRLWPLVLHIRQDLKLVAFLLAGVIIMLGVVADRLH